MGLLSLADRPRRLFRRSWKSVSPKAAFADFGATASETLRPLIIGHLHPIRAQFVDTSRWRAPPRVLMRLRGFEAVPEELYGSGQGCSLAAYRHGRQGRQKVAGVQVCGRNFSTLWTRAIREGSVSDIEERTSAQMAEISQFMFVFEGLQKYRRSAACAK